MPQWRTTISRCHVRAARTVVTCMPISWRTPPLGAPTFPWACRSPASFANGVSGLSRPLCGPPDRSRDDVMPRKPKPLAEVDHGDWKTFCEDIEGNSEPVDPDDINIAFQVEEMVKLFGFE